MTPKIQEQMDQHLIDTGVLVHTIAVKNVEYFVEAIRLNMSLYPNRDINRSVTNVGGVEIVESKFLDVDYIGHAFDSDGRYLKEILLY